MPIIVNVARLPLLPEPIDRAYAESYAQGLAEGRATGLAKAQLLLTATSFGSLPDDLVSGLMWLEPEEVSLVMRLIRHVLPAVRLEAPSRPAPPGTLNGQE